MDAVLSPVVTQTRRDPRGVKIAHVSDFHFSGDMVTVVDDDLERNLKRLRDDIADQQPDLVCVTGDVADSSLKEATYEDWKARLSRTLGYPVLDFRDLLTLTWRAAREYFVSLCDAAGIPASDRLFVIPGNHDYRVQGFGASINDARTLFRSIFGEYLRSARFVFRYEGEEPIGVAVLALDSNPPESEKTALATGLVTEAELERFAFLVHNVEEFEKHGVRGLATFRVCLLHHHPLPVVPAETYHQLSSDPAVLERFGGFTKTLMGVQTTVLRNAGTFMCAAVSAGVDLVLHGHEHSAWGSEIRYPTASDFHRMLVVAAGSARIPVADAYTYNVVNLYRDGRIEVTQRTLEKNQTTFSARSRFPNYDSASLRSDRRRRTEKQLEGRPIESDLLPDRKLRYGAMRADRVANKTVLSSDGNAQVTRSFEGLRATDQDVRYLPIIQYSPHGYLGLGGEPKVVQSVGVDRTRVVLSDLRPQQGRESGILGLEFSPPLQREYPVSFEITYQLRNGYEFVSEYRRARWNPDAEDDYLGDRDAVRYRSRIVFHERYSETVVFPRGLTPKDRPSVRVYEAPGRLDALEQAYCAERFHYFAGDRTATLAIDNFLPNMFYELSWPLTGKSEFENKQYDPNSLRVVRAVGSMSLGTQVKERLIDAMRALRTAFSSREPAYGLQQSLMDSETEITLFLLKHAEGNVLRGRSVRVTLSRVGCLRGEVADVFTEMETQAGVGLAGQALRRGGVLLDHSEGRSGFYKMEPEQQKAHEFLCAIPLRALRDPAKNEASSTRREAIYGMLTIGSDRPGSGLEQLFLHRKSAAAARLALVDWVQGEFGRNVLSLLGVSAGGVGCPKASEVALLVKSTTIIESNVVEVQVEGRPISADSGHALEDVWRSYEALVEARPRAMALRANTGTSPGKSVGEG